MRLKLAEKIYDNGHFYLRRGLDFPSLIYLQDLLERYPGTEWAPRALAGIIDAYTSIGYEDEVDAARSRLLAEYPDSPEAEEYRTPSQNGGGGDSTSGGLSH